ncbi:MipA/OmpV family protein [Vibrio porteresiae]|uniref:MipA/OmpV family protein n=1 Tax=Vibrio porteresiae DSM 19223 TaxID=1123496 RepID=A0ABZ0QB61_9VIBR|nr:MipA/OmpV family protein [Vibrio porteresiae]WPC73140.1 MipA/OmpV family protein [Vibrio porteresiae DSM 19223]
MQTKMTDRLAKTLLVLGIGCTSFAHAAEPRWSVGVGGGVSSELYKDTDYTSGGTLVGGYEGDYVYFRGRELGYRVLPKDSVQNFSLRLIYDGRHFDPDDSSNRQMRELDKRHATGLIGPKYELRLPLGKLEAGAAVEFTGEHNGYLAHAGWSYPIIAGAWGLIPGVGFEYNSSKMANYLYGVSASEASRSGLDKYKPSGAGQFYLGLNGFYKMTDHVRFDAGVRLTSYDNEIKDSPMVSHGENVAFFTAASYLF